MKFLIDMQLPRALSRALRAEGHDVVWLRCGNLSNAELLPLVIQRLSFICGTIEAGARLIEIR